MKKIEVKHTSDFICIITMISSFVLIYLMLAIFIFLPNIVTLLLFFLSIFLLLVVMYFNRKKTVVEYNAEKIQWKYFFHSYNVKFSEINHVHYTTIHAHTQSDGYNHRFEIVFNLKNDSTLRLNDSLTGEDIDNCIIGIIDNIKLMQLYKFIENIYPEKAQGFIKTSSEIF